MWWSAGRLKDSKMRPKTDKKLKKSKKYHLVSIAHHLILEKEISTVIPSIPFRILSFYNLELKIFSREQPFENEEGKNSTELEVVPEEADEENEKENSTPSRQLRKRD